MNAKDDSKVTDYVAAVAIVTGHAAVIEQDINLTDDSRLTLVRSDGRLFAHVIVDSDAGEELAAELVTYPVESSSSSSSSGV